MQTRRKSAVNNYVVVKGVEREGKGRGNSEGDLARLLYYVHNRLMAYQIYDRVIDIHRFVLSLNNSKTDKSLWTEHITRTDIFSLFTEIWLLCHVIRSLLHHPSWLLRDVTSLLRLVCYNEMLLGCYNMLPGSYVLLPGCYVLLPGSYLSYLMLPGYHAMLPGCYVILSGRYFMLSGYHVMSLVAMQCF